MAIDNAAYISLLDKTSPANRDPRVEGAAQIRAVKTALHNSFPNIDGPIDATAEQMNAVINGSRFVTGMIMMFSGDTAPDNWAFCDGSVKNGIVTPDLRNRFIMGANVRYNSDRPISGGEVKVGTSGGTNVETDITKKIKVVNHSLSIDQMPAHTHDVTGFGTLQSGESGGTRSNQVGYGVRRSNAALSKGGGGGHNHKLDVGSGFDNRPSWYALAYIVFVGPTVE